MDLIKSRIYYMSANVTIKEDPKHGLVLIHTDACTLDEVQEALDYCNMESEDRPVEGNVYKLRRLNGDESENQHSPGDSESRGGDHNGVHRAVESEDVRPMSS